MFNEYRHRISSTIPLVYSVDKSPFFCLEQYVRGAGNENVGWFFDSRWTNYCHAPKYFSACEELKVSFKLAPGFENVRKFLWLELTIYNSWIKHIMSVTLTACEKKFFSWWASLELLLEQDSADMMNVEKFQHFKSPKGFLYLAGVPFTMNRWMGLFDSPLAIKPLKNIQHGSWNLLAFWGPNSRL